MHIVIILSAALLSFGLFPVYGQLGSLKDFALGEVRRGTLEWTEGGLPLKYYGTLEGTEIGWQIAPVNVAVTAMNYYEKYKENPNDADYQTIVVNANWIVRNAEVADDSKSGVSYATLLYEFPWPYMIFLHPGDQGWPMAKLSKL